MNVKGGSVINGLIDCLYKSYFTPELRKKIGWTATGEGKLIWKI